MLMFTLKQNISKTSVCVYLCICISPTKVRSDWPCQTSGRHGSIQLKTQIYISIPGSTTTLLKRFKNVFGMLGKHFIKRCYNVILCGFSNVDITFFINIVRQCFENILNNVFKTF